MRLFFSCLLLLLACSACGTRGPLTLPPGPPTPPLLGKSSAPADHNNKAATSTTSTPAP